MFFVLHILGINAVAYTHHSEFLVAQNIVHGLNYNDKHNFTLNIIKKKKNDHHRSLIVMTILRSRNV